MKQQSRARQAKSGNAQFAMAPRAEIPRSTFNRSSTLRSTFDSGLLIPIYADEILPGDTVNLNMRHFTRMATPLKPLMDGLHQDFFFFFVPLRLLWDNFQKFMGEQDNPGDSTDFICPISTSPVGGYAAESLHDYFGIPTQIAGLEHNNFLPRAYNLIYKEWFRRQDFQDSPPINTGDGPDDPADYELLRRTKPQDYFVAALPQPQKGPAVQLPLGTTAPLLGSIVGDTSGNFPTLIASGGVAGNIATAAGTAVMSAGGGSPPGGIATWANPGLDISGVSVDLSAATAATINVIRQAFQIQRLYERDQRGGTRYTEIVRSHFGVVSPDARLQRPEYLGGGSSTINMHPIAQTGRDLGSNTLGRLAAFATGSSQRGGFNKSFTEHGVIIGLTMVRADITYQQGLHRMHSRSTRFDFFWSAFQHLGEQEILSKEIYADGTVDDDDVWGYIPRYDDYRYKPSIITGKFRANTPGGSLEVWHASQNFLTRPVLNADFLLENPPINRLIAIPSEPEFLFDAAFDVKHTRPMPIYSIPGMVDHF